MFLSFISVNVLFMYRMCLGGTECDVFLAVIMFLLYRGLGMQLDCDSFCICGLDFSFAQFLILLFKMWKLHFSSVIFYFLVLKGFFVWQFAMFYNGDFFFHL